MTHRVGIIGLGQMGRGMLERLRGVGFEARGYDLMSSRSETSSVAEICRAADVVLLSLPDGASVEQTVDNGIAESGHEGLTVVDCSTDTPETARRVAAALSTRGIGFLDAPVSGGREGARSGLLTMLVGGSSAVLESAMPVLDALAEKIVHVGDVGSGQVAKLANNLLVATGLAALAEVVQLAGKSGLKPASLIEAVNACSGRSAVSEVNFPRWILNGHFDSGFSAGLMRKDIRLAIELAGRLGVELELGERVLSKWDGSEIADEADFNRIVEIRDDLEG